MKKLFIIAVIFASLTSKGQNATIIYTDPEQLCKGDSTKIVFSLNSVPSGVFNVKMYIKGTNTTIFTGQGSDLKSEINGYYVWYKMPSSFSTGQFSICSPLSNCYYLWLNDCVTTGLSECEAQNTEVLYYDVQGDKIKARKNELIIEQRGSVRKKIIIFE